MVFTRSGWVAFHQYLLLAVLVKIYNLPATLGPFTWFWAVDARWVPCTDLHDHSWLGITFHPVEAIIFLSLRLLSIGTAASFSNASLHAATFPNLPPLALSNIRFVDLLSDGQISLPCVLCDLTLREELYRLAWFRGCRISVQSYVEEFPTLAHSITYYLSNHIRRFVYIFCLLYIWQFLAQLEYL